MAGLAGRPTRRVTGSSYGSRGHPNRGETRLAESAAETDRGRRHGFSSFSFIAVRPGSLTERSGGARRVGSTDAVRPRAGRPAPEDRHDTQR